MEKFIGLVERFFYGSGTVRVDRLTQGPQNE
jgi:hypothetical protein